MDATHENIKAILFEILSEYPQRARIEKTFIDAYSEYLRWGEFSLSKKTLTGIKTAYNHFIAFRGNVALHEIDKRFIDQFAITLMKKAPKGSRVYFRSYRAMFQKFVEWGFIPKNSFSSLKLPKQQRNELKYFTENEFLSLAEKETNQNLRDLFILCFYLGLRLAEIINLIWENVHLEKKFVLIGDESFITKARKIRRVPICEKASRILEKRIPKIYHANKRNYVFTKSNGFPFSGDWVSKSFKKLIRDSGLSDEFHFHSIRHSTASNLARLGVPVPVIQQILGHSNVQTTMLYTHTNINDLINAVTVFDNCTQQQIKNYGG